MMGQIFILDDNELDLKIVSSLLGNSGFECAAFTDHNEALNWLEQNSPQIIFLDLQMPVVSGFDILPILKSQPRLSKIPTIILSGNNQANDVLKAISLGASDYIIKPVDIVVLQEKIRKTMKDLTGLSIPYIDVDENTFPNIKICKSVKIVAFSEFGVKAISDTKIPVGEILEISGFPKEQFGFETAELRCLTAEPINGGTHSIVQLTFTNLNDKQRQKIRKSCQHWPKT